MSTQEKFIELENKAKVVLDMLQSELAWEYQRFKSSTESSPIKAFVSRNAALEEAKKIIQKQLDG